MSDLQEIVALGLMHMGCNALFLHDDDCCGCKIDDLFPCGDACESCEPAIWHENAAHPISKCQCKNCGSTERLDVLRSRGHLSCCPEREMIPNSVAELNAIFEKKPNAIR